MQLPTYHCHCHYCDGEGSPEDFVRKAVNKGAFAHGFSSHGPVGFPNQWSMKPDMVDEYCTDIRVLKSSYSSVIEIYTGLESDYIPGKSSPSEQKEKYGLDYVIGSVHYVKQFNSGVPWQIDGSPEDFERGYTEIFNRRPQALINEYYSLIRSMVENACPDVIGHIDKIKMHNGPFRLFREDDSWYLDELRQTLEVIRDAGVIIEVNTRSIYKKARKEPYPGYDILRMVKEMNIPIMVNSDAHHPSETYKGYSQVLKKLDEIGFGELKVFRSGEWTDIKIGSLLENKD
ncbi:MAG: histidinol-phosphatase [Cyclobacteriaceae bacterium]